MTCTHCNQKATTKINDKMFCDDCKRRGFYERVYGDK